MKTSIAISVAILRAFFIARKHKQLTSLLNYAYKSLIIWFYFYVYFYVLFLCVFLYFIFMCIYGKFDNEICRHAKFEYIF